MKERFTRWMIGGAMGALALGAAACGEDPVTGGIGQGSPCQIDEDCGPGLVCSAGFCAEDPNGNIDEDTGDDPLDPNDPDGGEDTDTGNDPDTDTDTGDDPDTDTGTDPIDPVDPDVDRRDDRPVNPQCVYGERGDTFVPDETWSFRVEGSIPYATYDGHGSADAFAGHAINQVMMTPAVANLTDDNDDGIINEQDIPEVIFTTFLTNEVSSWDTLVTGVLRAVSGDDGSHLWSVGYREIEAFRGKSPADYRVSVGFQPAASVAVGDINNDGKSEIIAALFDYQSFGHLGFAALSNEGDILWISDDVSPTLNNWWGGPSIADIDGDGEPEIVVGSVVYDNQGRVMWDGREAPGLSATDTLGTNRDLGPLSVVADLDLLDDSPVGTRTQEIITGNAVFTHDGQKLWESPLADGFPAVADFNGSGFPEVVVVSDGTVRIHDGRTGTLVWGPVNVGAGRLGAPTIADFTGDGRNEIGVAGSTKYVALRVDYGLPGADNTPTYSEARLWERTTQDQSSNVTGSSVFDFNGDGRAEVVYNDELFLRVYDGPTGQVLFEAENPSFTALENPVIVDVDNDGTANIVVATNDFECGDQITCTPGTAGLRVFADANDNWVATRRIWNQHAYSINNVNEDGSIPAEPEPSYRDHNTFRLNSLTTIDPQAAPDLLAEAPEVSADGCAMAVSVWVTNSGAVNVGPDMAVSFYVDRNGSREYLTTGYTTQGLEPGQSERVRVGLSLPSGSYDIIAVVDDVNGTGSRNECNENNNSILIEGDYSC